jgi:hypothetical protein
MDGKTGKRFEWQFTQDAHDPLATFMQDYDWADEVLHARIGRRWLKPDVGDVKALLKAAEDQWFRPSPTVEAGKQTAEQVDWWPEFVRDALGKETTSELVTGLSTYSLASG